MNIKQMSITELKALAYDQLAQIEMNQANLRAINAEITKRNQQEQPAAQSTEEPTNKE
jgi:hypothetical protein